MTTGPERTGPPVRFDGKTLSDHPLVARASVAGSGVLDDAAIVVAIPAMNEEERIGRCLDALLAELTPDDGVVLVVNDSTDRTAARAQAALDSSQRPFRLIDLTWRPGAGSAPRARRLALDCAAELASGAHLLSLDADTIVQPGWRAAYAALFGRGFDLVCGGIGFIPEEAALLPPADPEGERLVREARALTREAEALIDPDPDNPWPHHGNIGGANFGLRAGALQTIGGVPDVPSGEDRALLARARALRLRVRFAGNPCVWTSCRLEGRAAGGLSDDLARSRRESDPLVDEMLEPADRLELRLRARRRFRDTAARAGVLLDLGIDGGEAAAILALPSGEDWLAAERRSPALRRRAMRRSELAAILPGLEALTARLRA